MAFFNTNTLYKVNKTTVKNELKQNISTYKKGNSFTGDIQPITETSIKYDWGYEIKSKLQLYCDEEFKVNDLVMLDDKLYKIEAKSKWSYGLYALLESDEVLDNEI